VADAAVGALVLVDVVHELAQLFWALEVDAAHTAVTFLPPIRGLGNYA
jgi:hypothetical protein